MYNIRVCMHVRMHVLVTIAKETDARSQWTPQKNCDCEINWRHYYRF